MSEQTCQPFYRSFSRLRLGAFRCDGSRSDSGTKKLCTSLKPAVSTYAARAARQIASDGAFSGGTIQALTQVAGSGHFSIRVRTGDGYDAAMPISTANVGLATRNIQQGTAFTVVITSLDTNTIGISGVENGNISVYGAANGVSAPYWKEDQFVRENAPCPAPDGRKHGAVHRRFSVGRDADAGG